MEIKIPVLHAQARPWLLESTKIERYHALSANWTGSSNTLSEIRQILKNANLDAAVKTVAVAGSLGRMEASERSDCDLIIVLSDDIALKDDNGNRTEQSMSYYHAVWTALESLSLEKPKPTGVFAKPTNEHELLSSMGDASEGMEVFGKRLLLLLESQPVLASESYEKLIDAIVHRYARGYVEQDSTKEWTFLLNDLIRYFRAICVNYQWSFDNETEKWPLRNIKLRHSRLVMYGGLLFLLGEASKIRQDKVMWLRSRLAMTPLERMAWVYESNQDWSFHRVAGLYDVFLSRISDAGTRQSLNVDPGDPAYGNRFDNPPYAALKANSDALMAEFIRFVFARRGAWSERFFEYLIF